MWESFLLEQSWNGRLVKRRAALFTFLRIVPLNISHLTPQINFSRDEVEKKSWNSNISTFLWCIFHSLDLFDGVNRATSVTTRRFCVYPPKSDTCAEKQATAAACWEPKMSYKQHNTWPSETDNLWTVTPQKRLNPLRLNKTCQATQAGV